MEFDHVGVFTYSPEPGTKAVALDLSPVPPAVAEERRAAVMELQQGISLRKNRALVGRTLQVLIEAVGEAEDEAGATEPVSVGRARRHAPEVDGLVFVPGALPVGHLIDLEIAAAGPYDLWAHPPGQTARAARSVKIHPAAAAAARRRRVSTTRSRAASRPERRAPGRPVPLATPAGT
jgi:ribosomal protein S12 methylthiotransferase